MKYQNVHLEMVIQIWIQNDISILSFETFSHLLPHGEGGGGGGEEGGGEILSNYSGVID